MTNYKFKYLKYKLKYINLLHLQKEVHLKKKKLNKE